MSPRELASMPVRDVEQALRWLDDHDVREVTGP